MNPINRSLARCELYIFVMLMLSCVAFMLPMVLSPFGADISSDLWMSFAVTALKSLGLTSMLAMISLPFIY